MNGFPRQQARTRRFTLGVPRGFIVGEGPDGPVVLFLRTDSGDDPVTHLWRHDPASGRTLKLVDARALAGDASEEHLPASERARRERAREQAGGIVTYAVDESMTVAAFVLAGRLHTVALESGQVREHPQPPGAFDPRLSPDGDMISCHAEDGLHLVALGGDGPTSRTLVQERSVAWGRAEFVAAEEMSRTRGHWWSPDGAAIAAARVDECEVAVWHLADPASPWSRPTPQRYPAAGSANADVSLWILETETGGRREVLWDREQWEYLAHVSWSPGPLTLLVQTRDQRRARVLTADPRTGATTTVREWEDRCWVELVPGTPTWCGDRLVTVEDRDDDAGGARRLCVDGEPVTPAGLQVREVVAADGDHVTILASGSDPTQVQVHRVEVGETAVGSPTAPALTDAPGVHRAVEGRGGGLVIVSHTLDRPGPRVVVTDAAAPPEGRELEVAAEAPSIVARPRLLELGPRRLRAALLLPDDDRDTQLPVVLDPYGGPHAQRVVQAAGAHLGAQWLADQGFAVLVVDGRGTPGRGPAWERAVHRDLATAVLDDQIDALAAATEIEPRLDLSRVGIRGWSFGGYLAALAVLRRPDVFRAAVAGAPVTDWRLYDTHYTERYLGDPATDPEAYAVSSLVDGDGVLLGAAPWPVTDPPSLLLIHGLADDNVVAAHTLRLSAALLADGRPHSVLPLSGVTHMTPQEQVAEHLLLQQAAFLRTALGRPR